MGDLIHSRYELIEALGVGGMGAVFRAMDRHLNRQVALKVARVEPSSSHTLAEASLLLKRESRALAQLNHPSIPVIYDYSGDTHEPAYLAMELIEGVNLAQVLVPKTPLPFLTALALLQKVAAALSHAHEASLIHGDMKPENLMIERGGRLILMDFGCTQATQAKVLGNTASVAGDLGIFGSLDFLSPEHISGDTLTKASDVFSFGTLAYLLSIGRIPFDEAKPANTMRRILECDYVPAETAGNDLPPGLTGLISACLQVNPFRRPTTQQIAFKLEEGFRTHWRTTADFELGLWASGLDSFGLPRATSNKTKEGVG